LIIDSGHVALARQQHLKADASLETHKEELLQLKVFFSKKFHCFFGVANSRLLISE